MNVAFELDLGFLIQEDIPLSADDLKYGFDHGWIGPLEVIDYATYEVKSGWEGDDALLRLASLLHRDADDLPEILLELDSPDRIHDPRSSHRKWLYLQLKAAFLRRNEFEDPLSIVEEMYAAFDYPESMAGLVRYMPAEPGAEAGITAIHRRWATFLGEEGTQLRSGSL